jgi:hypothetical protein
MPADVSVRGPTVRTVVGDVVDRLGVLGADPGIIRGLTDVRLQVIIAVADDGLTDEGDVLPTDIGTDALVTYNVLRLGFSHRHPGRHADDGSGKDVGGEGCRYVFHG